MAPSKATKDEAKKSTDSSSQEVEGEHNEWKFRAPYKVHTNGGFKPLYHGSCHCGRVQYELSREKPLSAKFCHCTTCQVLHGAPFQWAAIFHKEDINFSKGHHDLGWYDSGDKTTEHKLPCKVSCAYCRAPIMDEGRNMILLFPSLIKFKSNEEKSKFDVEDWDLYERDENQATWNGSKLGKASEKPLQILRTDADNESSCHMFYKDRLVDIPDGKPKWSGMSGKSDLIEDSPPEEVKKRKREIEEESKDETNGKSPKKQDIESGGHEILTRSKD